MRRDPLFFVFTITSASWQEAQKVKESLRPRIAPDSELIDTCVSSEGTKSTHYRIGDFFEEIELWPPEDGRSSKLGLLFHRQPKAGPFWKDIMVRIVHSLEALPGVSVSLDYQGDAPADWARLLPTT